jgi:hypothetical protein
MKHRITIALLAGLLSSTPAFATLAIDLWRQQATQTTANGWRIDVDRQGEGFGEYRLRLKVHRPGKSPRFTQTLYAAGNRLALQDINGDGLQDLLIHDESVRSGSDVTPFVFDPQIRRFKHLRIHGGWELQFNPASGMFDIRISKDDMEVLPGMTRDPTDGSIWGGFTHSWGESVQLCYHFTAPDTLQLDLALHLTQDTEAFAEGAMGFMQYVWHVPNPHKTKAPIRTLETHARDLGRNDFAPGRCRFLKQTYRDLLQPKNQRYRHWESAVRTYAP